jgi:CRP/FNR family transcriptional regulator
LDALGLYDVLADATHAAMSPRDMLFNEGADAAHVFTLMRGTAKLTRLLPDGREQILGFRFAGDVLGYTAAARYPYAVRLLTHASVCVFDRRHLDNLVRHYPALARRLLEICVQELAATQEQLVTVGRRPAEARVASFLLSLAEAGRRRQQCGAVLEMPMTRGDIADFLGLTLETVSRTLTTFRRRGWVREPCHARIELLRSDALLELTEGAGAS